MVQAVVWDIGNVFAYWRPEAHYDRLIGPERRARFFRETDIEAVNLRLDAGASATETLRTHAEAHPDWADEIRRWFDDWSEMFSEPVPGTAELFGEVKATGVRMVSLTNFWAETLPIAKRLHPALNGFDEEYVSAELKLIKPDPAFYEALEAGTGLSGPDLIFTDDKPENIAAAAARGWKTHLFEGSGGWRAALVAEGVLPA